MAALVLNFFLLCISELDLHVYHISYTDIQKKYNSYVSRIKALLKEKEVTVEKLYSFLIMLPFDYDQRMAKELHWAETIDSTFDALQNYFSFWDFEIFQHLIIEYGLDECLEELQYKEYFKCFIQQHTVSEFLGMRTKSHAESKYLKKLTLKFEIDPFHCTLAKVNELRKAYQT